MAHEDVKIARGAFMPTIVFSGNYFRVNETPSIPLVNNSNLITDVGKKNSFLIGATAAQPVYDPTLFAIKNSANKQKRVADLKRSLGEKEALGTVKKVYYKALFFKEMISLNKEFGRTVTEKTEKTESGFKRGTASGLEFAKAEGVRAVSATSYNEALVNYEASKDELKRLIGYPMDKEIILQGTLEEFVEQKSKSLTETIPGAVGVEHDQEVKLADAYYDLAKAEKKRVLTNFFPKLYGTFNLYATKPDLLVEPDDEFAIHYMATAHIGFPIFDGFRNLHEYHKAALQEKMALIGKEEARRSAQMKERARERQDQTEIIPLKGPKKTLEEARKTYDVAKVAKRTGFISAADYMGAEKYWAKSRADYSRAQLQWLVDQVDRE